MGCQSTKCKKCGTVKPACQLSFGLCSNCKNKKWLRILN